MSISNPQSSITKSDSSKSKLKLEYAVILPVLIALSILAYEDFLNQVFIQPGLYFLTSNNILTIGPKGSNEYILYVLLLNLILNIASLLLIYKVFFQRNLLAKQNENKQYGLIITVETYLALFSIVIALGLFFNYIQTNYFPDVTTSTPYDSIFPKTPDYSMLNLVLVVLLVCIMAPILEELIFRRILIPLLEGTGIISTPYAIVISASVFAFIHSESDLLDGSIYFAVAHFSSAFVLGLGLAGIYVSTRNVKYTMFYHGLNNFVALFPQILLAYYVTDVNNPPAILIIYSLLFLLVIILGIVFIIFGIAKFDRVKYPLKSQFTSKIRTTKKTLALLLTLVIQGIIFIFIPFIEGWFFDNFVSDVLIKLIINALLFIAIFGFFIAIWKKKIALIRDFGQVKNPPLPELVDPRSYYQGYQGYQTYGSPNQEIAEINTNKSQNLGLSPNSPDSMQCPNCGKNIPKGNYYFCPLCGFSLKEH